MEHSRGAVESKAGRKSEAGIGELRETARRLATWPRVLRAHGAFFAQDDGGDTAAKVVRVARRAPPRHALNGQENIREE